MVYICPGKCCPDFSGYAIQPTIPESPILTIVGEAAGIDENRKREFFVGKTGQEMDNYLRRVGIPRERCHITNILKCWPPGNRDPKQSEVAACSSILLQELEDVKPRFIATLGRFATRFFLGDVDMEAVHGIPHKVGNYIIIPTYHPAAGLHDTVNMSNIMSDFVAIKATMMGTIPMRRIGVETAPPPYRLIEPGEDMGALLNNLVAIDTETEDEDDTPWCMQFCCGDQGCVIMKDNTVALAQFAEHVANPDVLCIIHNSLFDLKVLALMGVYPANFTDTMIMAYLLQTEPQGLKPLTFRHLNVRMREYEEVVGPRTQEMALEYVVKVACMDWPKLDPVLEMKAGKPKIRQPQTINQKVNRILSDISGGGEVDVYDRWRKTPPGDGRTMVETVLGPLKRAYLKDVEVESALQYAGTDPWATYYIYPILKQKIEALGLSGVLARDNGIVPMVETMQRRGMKVNPDYLRTLRTDFTTEMDQVAAQICSMVGYDLHPGSDPQVLDLLENKLRLVKARVRMVDGKQVTVRKKMTDLKAMELLKDKHPVVPLVMRYRALAKLVDSFIDVILEKRGPDNRIRTTLRVTRVVTGRLASSNPNLMAQPTRTEDGRRIRGGFEARTGYKLISGDYSQIEMRIVAHISQDPKMLEVFRTGVDIHSATASGIFHLPLDQLDEMKHRYPAKRVGFGILNLISAAKLLQELAVGGATGWTVAGCQTMINEWFTLYAGVADYVEERKVEARRTGMVRDLFGRVRLVPEVMSVHESVREAGIRQAVNAPIQMGAQGVIKEAMVRLVPIYKGFGEDIVTPLLQIHDDLLWEMREDLVPIVLPIVKQVMENCVELSVPLKVDFKIGDKWAGMKKTMQINTNKVKGEV